MNNIVLATLVIMLTTYSQLVLRIRLQAKGLTPSLFSVDYWFSLLTDVWVVSTGVSLVLSFACWSLLLSSNANIAKIYPIVMSLVLCLVSTLSIIIFNDRLSMINALGGGLIIVGIFLLLSQSSPGVVSAQSIS